MEMSPKARGAWIVHHSLKLDGRRDHRGFKAVRLAGNCGTLLSSLAASDEQTLDLAKVEALALVHGIELTYQLPTLLDKLQSYNLIDRSESGIAVLGLATSTVLEHTARIFTEGAPTGAEEASIEVAELCSQEPREERALADFVEDRARLPSREALGVIEKIEEIGFCDVEPFGAGEKLLFNGNLFRRNEIAKAKKVIESLTATERANASEMDQRLASEGCIAKSDAMHILGNVAFSKLASIGFYDISTVSNEHESSEYITRPSAFNKFGRDDLSDSFDLAKALVASLKYGMTRSKAGRGRIDRLGDLMRKLITGASVGPCTAIGQDYRVLELRGVVRVIPERNMFKMKLLKREIGELALQVLQSGDASGDSLMTLPGSPVALFVGPEENRGKQRQDGKAVGIEVGGILDVLRTGGL